MPTEELDELRYRWSLKLPEMIVAVKAVARANRSFGSISPLKVGSLPSKGVPSPRDTVQSWRDSHA